MTRGPREAPPIWTDAPNVAAARLGTDLEGGLSADDAAQRLSQYGPNAVHRDAGPGPWTLFLAQFRSLTIGVLLLAAALSWLLGEWVDALAILAILLLNAGIGFYQEFRAEAALASLRRLTAPTARVVRDGQPTTIPAAEMVPGDLLLLSEGDLVPADARVTSADELRTNEAPLTGEAEPVQKQPGPLPDPETPLADRRNMVYLGTGVCHGQGRGIVTATGGQTEMGQIAGLLGEPVERQTALQRRIDEVSRTLLCVSSALVAAVFLLGWLRGAPPLPMLLTSVSLAIAAVPEGLPAVVTVAFALGVGRMVHRHALVRRLAAVETLGNAQVICSDKTGTLTLGRMAATALWAGGAEWPLARNDGALAADAGIPPPPQDDGAARLVLAIGAACNEATLVLTGGPPEIVGDPTEGALLAAAAEMGIRREEIERECPRVATYPFASDRQRMTVVRQTPTGVRACVKGAPEAVLPRCSRIQAAEGTVRLLTAQDRETITTAAAALAGRGLRVLATAYRDLASCLAAAMETERELVFAGLVGLQDPPRPEAVAAIEACRRAGVRVVMITGDHPGTAAAIGRELNLLLPGDAVVTGRQLQEMDDATLRDQAPYIRIFARVTAADKLRIVRALQASGLVVAMTGDGVNDAPALRHADIGVAMGRGGTDISKEAADMVITDDNFASIVAAVEEGRGVYDNIRKCLQYLLAGNTAEILVMLVAALAGWPMPLLPLQLLWINLVTDGLPALALAADPVEPDVLDRPPRAPDERLANAAFFRLVLLTGTLTAATALAAFAWGLYVQKSPELARNYAFATLVYAELLRSFGARSTTRPVWRRGGEGNVRLAWVVGVSLALQALIHHLPPLQKLFSLKAMPLQASLFLFALGSLPLFCLELGKVTGPRLAARGKCTGAPR